MIHTPKLWQFVSTGSIASYYSRNAVRTNGVLNVSDGILIYLRALEEHHERIRNTLQRLQDRGLTLHRQKCLFYKNSIDFFRFHTRGLRVDPEKVEAIWKATIPWSATGVRSFLGMATYCGWFTPNLATLSEPLRALSKTDATWEWDGCANMASCQVKEALLVDATMTYFNPRCKTELMVEASLVGLVAILRH